MTQDTTTMPDWVLIEAAKRLGWLEELTSLREEYAISVLFAQFADLIAKHETPPIDEDRDALIDVFQAAGLEADCCTPAEFTAAKAVIRNIRESGHGK